MLRFIGLPGAADPYVRIVTFDDKTILLFKEANEWSKIQKIIIDINAVDNGTHSVNTLHGKSLAWDLDTEGDRPEDLKLLSGYLKMRLPPPYEVVLESTHVHIEWDTHLGR